MDANTYLSKLTPKERAILNLIDAALSGKKKAVKLMAKLKLPYTKEGFTEAVDKLIELKQIKLS